MPHSLSLAGLIMATVETAKRFDGDPVRYERYDAVLLDLDAAIKSRNGELTLAAMEEIFAAHALPTVHLTQILRGL